MVIQGVTYLSDFEAKKAIISAAARLEAKGWMPAGDGAISIRVGPNAVWTTLAGSSKSSLTQDMLIRVDLNGKAMGSAHPKPLPEDLPIHLKIYQEHKDVQCVIHSYPVCAAILGIRNQSLEAGSFTPAVRRLGRIKCLPAAAAPEQAAAVSLLCPTDHMAVIQADGCLAWGKDPTEAMGHIEALNYYCQVLEKSGQLQAAHCSHACGNDRDGKDHDCEPRPVRREPECVSGSACVTGLLRPGSALPPLPGAETPAQKTAAQPSPPSAEGPVPAADGPKEEVMAEVIRKTLAMLG